MKRDSTIQKTEEIPHCFHFIDGGQTFSLDLTRADWIKDEEDRTTVAYGDARFHFSKERGRLGIKNAWCRAKHLGDDIQKIFPARRLAA